MQSSTVEPTIVEADDPVTEEQPPPMLIMMEPAEDAAEVCSVDGWCA